MDSISHAAADPVAIRALIEAGELPAALLRCDAALAQADAGTRAPLLALKSNVLVSMGSTLEALRVATEAHEHAQALGAADVEADSLLAIGFALQAMEEHERAIEVLGQAERLAKQGEMPALHAKTLRRFGISCSMLGRHEQAAKILEQASAMLEHHGTPDEWCHARFSVINARSRVTDSIADPAMCKAALRTLLAEWTAFADEMSARGFKRLEGMATGNAGISASRAGELDIAREMLGRAHAMHVQSGQRGHEGMMLNHLGSVFHALGRHRDAIDAYTRGLERLQGGSPRELMQGYEALAETYEAVDDARAALDAYKQARVLEKRLHDDDARIAAVRREQREEIARLADQWERLADEDALTGIANRRAFNRALEAMIEGGAGFALLAFDLDHFKQVNDRFGHAIGDAVLQRFAKILSAGRRGADVPARMGGEEFVLLLSQAERTQAAAVAEQLRATVESFDWSTVAAGLVVTSSIGVACRDEFAAMNLTPARILELADQRLYVAKHDGRNRVALTSV